ncbi:GTP cyclohydrolase I FolE [Yunchengibacter salinarum]|uniref:GTP cyclohydrolase I FolE n=1 Tax=Yunchengibacter salinarum TaxID=3133399 RepID=UPI0035B65A69
MDAVLESVSDELELKVSGGRASNQPSREEAEAAVRTLIRWAGDNPDREGLQETPKRVARAYEEFFSGYHQDPEDILSRTFEEVGGYDDMVVLRDIQVNSHCEHHMVPIAGRAHIAYMPDGRVVGISKLARVIEVYAKRLQTQETMTAQIADAVERYLKPKGVAVVIDATHQCMTCRGVKNPDVYTITRQLRGCFREERTERRFWDLVRNHPANNRP